MVILRWLPIVWPMDTLENEGAMTPFFRPESACGKGWTVVKSKPLKVGLGGTF